MRQANNNATFVCVLPNGEEVESDTLGGLIASVRKATEKKPKPVSIPVCMAPSFAGGEVTDYEATGIHAGTGNILLKDVKSGERSQHTSYGDVLLKPITQDDRERLLECVAGISDLERKRGSLITPYCWGWEDLKAEIVKRGG